MKHVVLPIVEKPYDDKVLFRGLEDNLVREQFFLIEQSDRNDQQIIELQGRLARTYQVGKSADWDDVFGNIQSAFLGTEFSFQLDLIIDAYGSKNALSMIQALQPVFPKIGLIASVKILFLADARSAFWQEEQALYNALKQGIFDAEAGHFSIKFNCAYLMIAQTEQQRVLRSRIMPFILQNESMMANPEIRTCGGQIRDLDINSIELVPKDLAIKTVCAMLSTKPLNNPLSMFFLATGHAANKSPKEQLELLKGKLEELVPIRLPAPVDLLVQKGTPDGDVSTKDLLARFCRDNPYSDPHFYDEADINALLRMPEIVNAVYIWENMIIGQACEKGDLNVYIEQLRQGSDFDLLLTNYQKPIMMNADKTLTDKDGYTETALEKLDQYTSNLQEMIRNSVFAARLRLIHARLSAVRGRLELVQRNRQKEIEAALSTSLTKNDTGLIENWCKLISTELTNAAAHIRLPKEQDDVSDWISQSVDQLLELIPPPDYETGKKELAESGARIIGSMRADTDEKLVTLPLITAIDVQLPDRWIVYRQMSTSEDYQRTHEPVVIKIGEWYLNLHQCAQMDEMLFQKPLNQVITQSGSEISNTESASADDEDNIDTSRLIPQEKEELDTYTGIINLIWKDMRYTNARLEVYADTGTPGATDKPVFTVNINFRSDDHYQIGRLEEFPSGVPLTFRLVYLDRGRDITDITHEFRMRSPKSTLDVELLQVKEGKLFGKKPYNRLKVRSTGSFFTDHIAVGSSTGHVYTAAWEQTEDGWLSELLPSFENWMLVDRPGDLVEYEIIQ